VSATPHAVVFARHPARRGAIWLKQAAEMLAAARIPWLMLLLLYYFIQLMVSVVPLVGPLAMMMLRPVFNVGFLSAAWTQERGGLPGVKHLFRGFRANLWALVPIGVVLIAGTTLAVLATALVDGGALLNAITGNAKPDEALVANGRLETAMLFAIVCALPTLLAVWFAPALVVFQDCGATQALGGSLRAALANWRPVAYYGLLLFFYGAVLPGIAVALIAYLVPPAAAPWVVALTVVPYIFLFVAAQTISDYVAYRDIFHPRETEAAPSTDADAGA
jgi:magnesium-transporting ATPase (P-type)